jgi:hypothetical protein
MSRPSESNTTKTTMPATNVSSAFSSLTHPSGHTITISADYGIWDETSNKALLPQDLKR